MKRRLLFLVAVFVVTVLFLAVQKLVFLLFHMSQMEAASQAEWLLVLWHGLPLDVTVAGYITAFPLIITLLSVWIRLPARMWRRILMIYFAIISLFTAVVFAVDLALYGYWGFRIDGTILIYLADPKQALASVELGGSLRQILIFGAYSAGMIWGYGRVVRLFSDDCIVRRLPASGLLLLLGGLIFIAMRGGLTVATANISKVYFSRNMFLNHAATNPLFSLLSTLGDNEDFASKYPFFDEQVRAAKFEFLRGNRFSDKADSVQLLHTDRPNVVLIILESFGRTLMDAEVDGRPVMPYMQRFKTEGVWFENFFANSFRTDRGEVAVMNGFPAQTGMSVMKFPTKSRTLPSIARSLAREGYATCFTYGGDLNFTNQASYMYSTGWERLVWQKDLRFDAPTSKWGYADDVMTDYFAGEVLSLNTSGKPFLAGLLTLSSHEPFDVPFSKFNDKILNAMAFTDDCVGRMIERWRNSPAWNNLLVILVADHAYSYPEGMAYNTVLRHRIPMIWLGGALKGSHATQEYASQIDLAATLLAQMSIDHSDFDYSKDIFDPRLPKFGYYTFVDGFGVVDANGVAICDNISGELLEQSNPALIDVGRTMLQTTYVDIGKR